MQLLVRRLPEKLRAVLVLRYGHDLSCAEIAEPEGTVKTRLHGARKALGRMLAAHPGGGPVNLPGSAPATSPA